MVVISPILKKIVDSILGLQILDKIVNDDGKFKDYAVFTILQNREIDMKSLKNSSLVQTFMKNNQIENYSKIDLVDFILFYMKERNEPINHNRETFPLSSILLENMNTKIFLNQDKR